MWAPRQGALLYHRLNRSSYDISTCPPEERILFKGPILPKSVRNRNSFFVQNSFQFNENTWKSPLSFVSRNGVRVSSNIRKHNIVNEHPWATTEASEGSRPPRSAAASGIFFWPAAARRLPRMALGAPSPEMGSYSGRTSQRSRDVMVGSVTGGGGRRIIGFAAASNFFEASQAV